MRNLGIFFYSFSTLFFLLGLSSYAQLQLKVFDTESGLSNNFVRKIVQDKTGYLWIGTTNGLNRFDGYSFKVFKHNPHDDNSIADNVITALAVDKSNRIWVGHSVAGVTCYDPSNNRFKRYKLIGDTASISVKFIQIDSDGLIWIGIGGHGVVVLNPQTNSLQRIDLSPHINKGNNPKDFVNFNTVFGMYEDAENIVWLATADGLYRYNKRTNKLKAMRLVDDNPDKYRNNPGKYREDYFVKVISDRNGGLWLSSILGGISHYHPGHNSFKTYKYGKKYYENMIWGVVWRGENQFWISTERGLGTFDIQSKAFSFFKPSDILNENNDTFSMGELFLDRTNILWGSSADGLVMITERINSCVFKPVFDKQTPFEVNDIVDDYRVEKKFFATSYGKGLLVSNKDDSNWRFFECRINSFYGNDNVIQDLLDEDGDSLWVVSRDNVRLFDKVNERWIDLPQLQKMESRITPSFYRMIKCSSGDYWVASFRNGAYYIKRSDFSTENFKPNAKNTNSICSNNLVSLLEDKLGRIRFASRDKGISIYDPTLNKFTRLANDTKVD